MDKFHADGTNRFLLRVFDSAQGEGDVQCALISLSPEEAKKILEGIARVVELKKVYGAGTSLRVCAAGPDWLSHVEAVSDDWKKNYHEAEMGCVDEIIDRVYNDDVVSLADGLGIHGEVAEVECNAMVFTEDEVFWEGRWGDIHVETASISIGQLEEIAGGKK